MLRNKWLKVLFATCFSLALLAIFAGYSAHVQADQKLHIDVPVKLEKANVVVDVGHSVFAGDMPFFIGEIGLLASDLNDWNAPAHIVAVFHEDAAYIILNDVTYNSNRHVHTGNPYGALIAGLIKQGVQMELCGASAAYV
jgi:intracellular sulfur oxidation DsrE/DsrF family protein